MEGQEDFPVTVTIPIESKADPKTGLRESADVARARLLGEAKAQAHAVASGYARLMGGGDAELKGLGPEGLVERDMKLTVQFAFRCKRK
ncbi:hypothetical protein HY251_11235 [bacterium]|nr:hypothetical protein [bacterium]